MHKIKWLGSLPLKFKQQIVDTYGSQVPEQFEVVKHIKAMALTVKAKDSGDGAASLTATCDTEENAAGLTEILEAMRQNFAGSGVSGTELLNKLTISVEGKNARLELAIDKADLEKIFNN